MAVADDTTDLEAKASVKRLIQFGHELHVLSDNTRHPVRTVDLRRIRYLQALILGRPVQLIRDLYDSRP